MPRRFVPPTFGAVPLVWPLAYELRAKPERGAKPLVHSTATARHSLASYPAAKPQR